MKLIIQNNRIAATATDDYSGPDFFIEAPEGFDIARMGEYRWDGAALTLELATRLSRLAFRNRFTQAEKVMLELACLDDPAAPMEQRQRAAAIRVQLADVAASAFVDLARADTRAGVLALEAAGMLSQGRAAEILDAPVKDIERPAP